MPKPAASQLPQCSRGSVPSSGALEPGKQLPRGERIRVTEHPLEIHLLFAVGTRLLLPDDAPAADAELVKAGERRVKGTAWGRSQEETGPLSRLEESEPPPHHTQGTGSTHVARGRQRCPTQSFPRKPLGSQEGARSRAPAAEGSAWWNPVAINPPRTATTQLLRLQTFPHRLQRPA